MTPIPKEGPAPWEDFHEQAVKNLRQALNHMTRDFASPADWAAYSHILGELERLGDRIRERYRLNKS